MLSILLAQINPIVGDIEHNTQSIIEIIQTNQANHDILVFPELAITGYPPEDLLLYPSFIKQAEASLLNLSKIAPNQMIIVGCVHQVNTKLFNSAAIIHQQKISFYHKQSLPNYGVFDERRYFTPGEEPVFCFEFNHHRFGILICEDLWQEESRQTLDGKSIQTLIAINASPYEQDKFSQRTNIVKTIANQGINVLYVNQVGGQDELIFDGQSFALDHLQGFIAKANAFETQTLSLQLCKDVWQANISIQKLPKEAEIYQALRLGLADFLRKNGLKKVVLGLSGGIDSALCLALAVDSLGAENVHAIIMPSKYSATMSTDDAISEAKALGVSYSIQPINELVCAFETNLPQMNNAITVQNIQARIRGMILMAYANEHQAMVLSTSNKSEAAVGYCTLYGDMCGGLAVLKDIYKTEVYALSRYRNSLNPVIPENVITRAPSAELAPNQKDEDDLPPYEILDTILYDMIEKRLSRQELIAKSYDESLIQRIQQRLKSSEFKRFQAAPGLKIHQVGFTKDWRIPISNRFLDF